MNLDDLRTFLAVAEEGSFSVAAERLHLTQPAVSKRLAGLEQQLGVRLLDRIGRRVELTEAGRMLGPRAQQMIREAEDIRRSITNLSGHVGGILRMGTSHHIGLHRLPPVLRRFGRKFPEVQLDIRFLGSEAACQGVEQGELELGIVTLPPEAQPKLILEAVWEDPLEFAVAADHPLVRATPTLADLAGYPAVLPSPGTFTRQILEQAWAPLNLPLQVAITTNYLETLKMLTAIGLGWSLLPRGMIDQDLRILHLPGIRCGRRLGIVTHPARTLSNAACAMIEEVKG